MFQGDELETGEGGIFARENRVMVGKLGSGSEISAELGSFACAQDDGVRTRAKGKTRSKARTRAKARKRAKGEAPFTHAKSAV
jgi:hypothetical protein